MGAHESIVGGFLGGFLEEGTSMAARAEESRERERVAGLQEIQTELAQRASITQQIGMEQDLADAGFNQIGPGEDPGVSFTGTGPAQVVEVGDQRYSRTSTPLAIQEIGLRAEAGAGKVDAAVVGKAIVLLSNVSARGGSIASASQLVEDTFGPEVLNAPGYRGIFTALSNQENVGARQERGIDVQQDRDERAETFAIARDRVNRLQDIRAEASKQFQDIVDRNVGKISPIEITTASGRRIRFESLRGPDGLREFIKQSDNPLVNEQVIRGIMEGLAGGPGELTTLEDAAEAINFEGR